LKRDELRNPFDKIEVLIAWPRVAENFALKARLLYLWGVLGPVVFSVTMQLRHFNGPPLRITLLIARDYLVRRGKEDKSPQTSALTAKTLENNLSILQTIT
jgi:hypothetical protein